MTLSGFFQITLPRIFDRYVQKAPTGPPWYTGSKGPKPTATPHLLGQQIAQLCHTFTVKKHSLLTKSCKLPSTVFCLMLWAASLLLWRAMKLLRRLPRARRSPVAKPRDYSAFEEASPNAEDFKTEQSRGIAYIKFHGVPI